jgi:hypothetical protein
VHVAELWIRPFIPSFFEEGLKPSFTRFIVGQQPFKPRLRGLLGWLGYKRQLAGLRIVVDDDFLAVSDLDFPAGYRRSVSSAALKANGKQ